MSVKSYSTQNQDRFVLAATGCKRGGTYLEIGAKHPTEGNNTYLLETRYGWRGVSVEISEYYATLFNHVRNNACICADALTLNYTDVADSYSIGPHIDYLQLDIEPAPQTFRMLDIIDFGALSFSVITFEHDHYTRIGQKENILERARQVLEGRGYVLAVSDVCHDGLCFEDWYINPQTVDAANWQQFAEFSGCNWNTKGMAEKHRLVLEQAVS